MDKSWQGIVTFDGGEERFSHTVTSIYKIKLPKGKYRLLLGKLLARNAIPNPLMLVQALTLSGDRGSSLVKKRPP
jgi:hypothetical protein